MMRQRLTIISCVYNESLCLDIFYQRIKPILDSLAEIVDVKLTFIENGSEDDSLKKIQDIKSKDPRIGVLTLSRNFGYQGALVAGLTELESDLYCILDVDCEDPPEIIPEFLQSINGGFHIVYGIRSDRKEPRYITWLRRQFYRWNRILADSEVIMWMSEFAMFTKAVRNGILSSRTTFPFLRTELGFIGYKRLGIPYRREKRVAGKSHYNLFSMAQFAVGGILAGTTLPLRLPFYLAPLLVAIFVIAACTKPNLSFLADLSCLLTFLYIICTLPFLCIYLARTYKNGVNRPLYIVDWSATKL